ncbi:hypothetical protein FNF28_00751 [Cafeteria roenbergensis]|uniref:Choline transporter-like protein n=1 Tax=Cafeteria roenbergensis TaxID=33653 RepID=A0A5A8E6S2_CAFRO|nr:hypothetical protein FNF28_00751 [Cafeteria roenbergensis]
MAHPDAGLLAADPYADGAVPPRVEVKNRPLRNVAALGVFGLFVIVNVGLGISTLTNVATPVTLAEEFNSCVATAGSDQHTLDIDKVKQGTSEFINELNDFIDQFSIPAVSGNPGIFAGLSIAAVALAGTWVYLMYRATSAMVWGTLILNVVLTAAVAVYMAVSEFGTMESAAVWAVLAVVQAAALFYLRANINMTAGILKLAMTALRDFPSLMLASILINVLVMACYVMQVAFIVAAVGNVTPIPVLGADIYDNDVPFATNDDISFTAKYCAVRMAIASAVFGTFYYFAPDDPSKPNNIVCLATTWAFTRQLGTHTLSGLVLAAVEALRRAARVRGGGLAGAILRCLLLIVLRCIRTLTRFLVVMTGLTGLGFWESAKRTMTIMREAFIDGYITSRLANRVLWLSGFVFSVVFGVIAWVSVDSQSLANQWPLAFVMIACIISPIVGIAMALLFSTILNGDLFNSPIDGLIAGLLFGSIAHALMRFMEQLILDLVDAAFMCFAIDTHNGIISPRGEVVHRFMGATFGDQLTDSAKAQPTVAAGAKGPTPDVMPPPVAGAAAVSTHKYNA